MKEGKSCRFLTSMTLEERRAARARGESQTDWARVRAAALRGEEPPEDEDSPDASAEMRAHLDSLKRKRGRPPVSGEPKIAIAFRCDPSVLAAFRASGPGWQTRMNAALADWLKGHKPAELPV